MNNGMQHSTYRNMYILKYFTLLVYFFFYLDIDNLPYTYILNTEYISSLIPLYILHCILS
jgi:hypothetical protein